MMSLSICINTSVIEVVRVQRRTNTAVVALDPDQVSTYSVDDGNIQVELDHRYGDGAIELAIQALQALRDERGDRS